MIYKTFMVLISLAILVFVMAISIELSDLNGRTIPTKTLSLT